MTLTVETSQVGPYQISQARTEASGGSSNDSLSSLSPKGLSEVLSDPSTSSSFNLLFFSGVLQYWKVHPRTLHAGEVLRYQTLFPSLL